jgi:hypothetical protein
MFIPSSLSKAARNHQQADISPVRPVTLNGLVPVCGAPQGSAGSGLVVHLRRSPGYGPLRTGWSEASSPRLTDSRHWSHQRNRFQWGQLCTTGWSNRVHQASGGSALSRSAVPSADVIPEHQQVQRDFRRVRSGLFKRRIQYQVWFALMVPQAAKSPCLRT